MSEKQRRFCHLCGKELQGNYLLYDNGLVVCKHCQNTLPHCSRCGIPSRQLTATRGELICPACLQKLPLCACCHEPILGRYFIIDDSPSPYCEGCTQTRPRCDICRVPFLDSQGKVFRGRDGPIYRCASCLSSAVTTQAEAERLYRDTQLLLVRELALEVAVLPKLHLVERVRLIELHQQAGILSDSDTSPGPEQQHLLGYFKRINDDWDIYIEHLLPKTLFQAVAAHELAHAWQSTHTPEGQALKIVEGFAEWVAYRVMLALGQQREAARLTRRNDLYGEGLQYFIRLEREHGRKGVLQRATQA